MKKTILLLILSIFSFHSSTAQQTIPEVEKLVSLGKVYGFLKYYHPEVGKGNYDWDKEFIKYLPKILHSSDKESLSLIYIDWIASLGNIEACIKCDSKEHYFDKNFDLSWTQDTTLFNNSLTSKLKFIEKNRIQEENFYVSTEPVGQIKVTNEPVYKDFEYPIEEYRLLGLFKYWNIIEYFYPYKYLTDQNWNSVLKEMIPKFQNASNKEEYQNTVYELIAKLDDSHAGINLGGGKRKYLPVKVSNIDNKAVISGFYNDSLAKVNNLKLGDVILKIDGMDVSTETKKELKYSIGSNKNIKTKNAYFYVLGGSNDKATLTIIRDDQTQQIKVTRYSFKDFNYGNNQNAIKFKHINDEIGYINMAILEDQDISIIFKSLENKKTIIIDLRNYPAYIYKEFSRYLNSEKRDFCKAYIPDINYPGKFIYKENLQTDSSREAFKGKVIILVNEQSQSRSEFTAMAFQTADNVITIGNQTAGADGDVVRLEYMGGYRTIITGIGILYPDGSETQRIGVKIDIEVKPTINGLSQGRDEVLEKAIELASE